GVWKQFPGRFEAALTDHLAGRDALVGWHARLAVNGLGASPTPRVWVGPDGWLFYNYRVDAVPSRQAAAAVAEVYDRWAAAARAWADWCAARGARLVVVVVPDKQSVYPELVPP